MPSSEIASRDLFLLRHAKSDWADPAQTDFERPLSARGRRSAAEVAQTLSLAARPPELVICSPALRTMQTLDAIREAIPAAVVELNPDVYLGAAKQLLATLQALGPDVSSVLLIGHNPGVSELASLLDPEGSATSPESADLPTAAMVHLQLDDTWATLSHGGAAIKELFLHRGTKQESL